MDIQYVITYFNKWQRPYYYTADSNECINTEYSKYETKSKDLALQIAKDFLDVPEAKMSLDEVRREFEDHKLGSLPEERLVAIQNFYNGRLAMYEHVKDMFTSEPWMKAIHDDTCKPIYSKRFEIPYEYNHFLVYADGKDECEAKKEKQLDSYLEVEVYAM